MTSSSGEMMVSEGDWRRRVMLHWISRSIFREDRGVAASIRDFLEVLMGEQRTVISEDRISIFDSHSAFDICGDLLSALPIAVRRRARSLAMCEDACEHTVMYDDGSFVATIKPEMSLKVDRRELLKTYVSVVFDAGRADGREAEAMDDLRAALHSMMISCASALSKSGPMSGNVAEEYATIDDARRAEEGRSPTQSLPTRVAVPSQKRTKFRRPVVDVPFLRPMTGWKLHINQDKRDRKRRRIDSSDDHDNVEERLRAERIHEIAEVRKARERILEKYRLLTYTIDLANSAACRID